MPIRIAVLAAAALLVVAPASAQTSGDYGARLAAYETARGAFEQDAKAYWSAIADKRRIRNAKRRERAPLGLDDYVLEQPPLYDGPPRPVDPDAQNVPRERKPLPVVADFLHSAATHFQFMPRRPASDAEFKRAYARAALAAGLRAEQSVRVYAFETGGNGNHDMQSGLSSGKPGARAISTAVGYNQLLTTNTLVLLSEQGDRIVADLQRRASTLDAAQRGQLERKIAVVKRMIAFARSVPNTWSEHEKLGATPQGWAVHALVLDVDVGPLLQVHKLLTSVDFARVRGIARPLSAAELEMMNLTGDGTGFDMVTMPQTMRARVPTANFFQRGGYERNPVAIRHNTVERLLAITDERMDANSAKPGARELAAAFAQAM